MNTWIFSDDSYQMNWFREDVEYAKVICPAALTYAVEHTRIGDTLETRIVFTNNSLKPVFTSINSIGIYFPLQDQYDGSQICMHSRCHTHILCNGNVSYIMALRMGGTPPHFGMILTEGSLAHYSIERDIQKKSNDRGIFILHPSPITLDVGESFAITWQIFSHTGKEDFYQKLAQFSNYVEVSADRYVVYQHETVNIFIKPTHKLKQISFNNEIFTSRNDEFLIQRTFDTVGEKIFDIVAGTIQTKLRLLVLPPLEQLVEKRCNFIIKHQQYTGHCKQLEGAYLAYDNEERHPFYSHLYDYNAGRERVGMALLLIKSLQQKANSTYLNSVEKYIQFVLRELVDCNTGAVYNDIGYDSTYKRLYNCPWYASLFVEWYKLTRQTEFLTYAVNIIRRFYQDGGNAHYPIELPVLSLTKALKEANMHDEFTEIKALFIKHANSILETETNYPVHEVKFEQSIVAPAADILLQVYLLTNDITYLNGGKKQMEILELFSGMQPDYRLNETAIRHWDGYWFGKKRLYGDTFPHYWSSLSGNIYALYALCSGEMRYQKKAETSLRGVLSLFNPDGSASCAYVYPYSVNGTCADYADSYANDQDWGLYFMLRYVNEILPLLN